MPPPRIERGLQVPETCVISFSPRGLDWGKPVVRLTQRRGGVNVTGRALKPTLLGCPECAPQLR